MQQLDLFRHRTNVSAADPREEPSASARVPATVADGELLAALPGSGIAAGVALAEEAGRRGLRAAVPALEALCRRLAGFGADRIVPEQAAAIAALAQIGGTEAARALAHMIERRIVEGPCLQRAVAAAAHLAAPLPAAAVLELLRDDDPRIRADACRLAQLLPEILARLRDLLLDPQRTVRVAAACALGRIGSREVRPHLVRWLREEPSVELIDAVTAIADEECIVLLGRIARTRSCLSEAALDALEAVQHPRASRLAAAIRATAING